MPPAPDSVLRETLARALPYIDSSHIRDDIATLLVTGRWENTWGRDNVKYFYTELDMWALNAMKAYNQWKDVDEAPSVREFSCRQMLRLCSTIKKSLDSIKRYPL